MRLAPEMYGEARVLIATRLGLDFPGERQADLERGLARACESSPCQTPEAYLAWLATLPNESLEWGRLAGHLTVGETHFFRDRSSFDALEQQVLPLLIAARRAEGALRLRLWSPGCATGEEPYSLAILLDRLLPDGTDWAVTILATDINPEALEAARRGRYKQWSFRRTPEWILDGYFHLRGAETFELDSRIRRMVTFAPLNLVEDGYPDVVTNTGAMDLILCRNVLMYFTHEAQRATVARLQRALVPHGWLLVSPAEASADLMRPLVAINFPGAIFYRKEAGGGQGMGARDQEPTPVPRPPSPDPLPPTPGPRPPTPAPRPLSPAPRSLLEQARTQADQGSLDQARKLVENALAQDRLDPEAHLLLAAICQEQGEMAGALQALRQAIYLAPDSAPAHFLLGSLLIWQGQRKRGRRSMETAVSLLSGLQGNEVLPGGGGMTAGRLLEIARNYLAFSGQPSA